MKRLLGLLLVMGIVGCGGGDEAPPAGETALPATPENAQAKVDEPPVQTVAVIKLVERDGLRYEGNSETSFTGVAVAKSVNGLKYLEETYKDGKPDGLWTKWNWKGKKSQEVTYKDGKKVSETKWDEEGNEIK